MGLDDTTPVIPEWARYLAVDADGSVWAYPSMPTGGHEGGGWPAECLWHPAQGPMPPSLACRLIVPLLVTKRHEPEPVEAER